MDQRVVNIGDVRLPDIPPKMIKLGVIRSDAVGAAFERVDRQLFLPDEPAERAYRDGPVAIKKRDGVTLSGASQPTMVAIMLQALHLERGQCVL